MTVPLNLGSLEWIVTNKAGTSLGAVQETAFTGDCDGSVDGMGISNATSASGATNAFDNAWMLFVNDEVFVAPAPGTVDLTSELLTAGPVPLSDLDTTLEILFSRFLQAARIRALFANTTNSAITVDVDVPINLGSDDATRIEAASIDDDVFTTADRWIVTSDTCRQ